MPSPRDFNIYKSYIVLASLGKLAEADNIARQGPMLRAIQEVADYLQENHPVTLKPLFRGLLLTPPVGPTISTHFQEASFVSFSEDHDVGCWFARPDSYISEDYLQRHPESTGWLASYTPASPSEILFHWTWQDELNRSAPSLHQVAEGLARQCGEDPAQWTYQVYFNLKNQKEVMLKPGPDLSLTPLDQAGCPPTTTLDKRCRPRPDFVLAPAGLESMGIKPRTKLYVTEAEFPKPLRACPSCGKAGIETIYVLDRVNLRVYKCVKCGQNSFATIVSNRRNPSGPIQHCERCYALVGDVGQVLCGTCWKPARSFYGVSGTFGKNTAMPWTAVPRLRPPEGYPVPRMSWRNRNPQKNPSNFTVEVPEMPIAEDYFITDDMVTLAWRHLYTLGPKIGNSHYLQAKKLLKDAITPEEKAVWAYILEEIGKGS